MSSVLLHFVKALFWIESMSVHEITSDEGCTSCSSCFAMNINGSIRICLSNFLYKLDSVMKFIAVRSSKDILSGKLQEGDSKFSPSFNSWREPTIKTLLYLYAEFGILFESIAFHNESPQFEVLVHADDSFNVLLVH